MTKYITCPPKDKEQARRLGLEKYVPSPGSEVAKCSECQCNVWIGVKQQAMMRAEPCIVHCFACSIQMMRKSAVSMEELREQCKSLGGESGEFHCLDGTKLNERKLGMN